MSKYRIGRYKKTVILAFADNATVATATGIELNGLLDAINIKTATTVDTSATTAVKLTDADGIDVYSKTGVAANTNTQTLLADATRVPLSGVYTLTVTFSASQTANRNTDITLLIDRGA